MIAELDVVVLTADIENTSFVKGDVGTVVHMYPNNEMCEVEFADLFGDTIDVVTVPVSKLANAKLYEGLTLHLNIAA